MAAIDKVKDFSKEPFIVERELHGPEFAVNYVMTGGHIQLLYFSSEHSQPGQKENMYSLICTTSCHLKQYLAEVNDKVIEVFKKIGCKEGNAWVECMLDRDGHFYILEMGYRFGGEMTVMPYEKVCGFNTVKFMLDIAKGVKHKVTDLPEPLNKAYREIAASYHLFISKEGNIAKIEGVEEVKKIPNVFVDMPKVVGSFSKLGLTMGIIRIFAQGADELCDIIARINSVLKITDAEGDNMFVYYDDFESIKREYNQGLQEFGLFKNYII